MIRDGRYRLNEEDGAKIIRLIGTLKEAIAELLSSRYTIIDQDRIDEIPTLGELTFYELAANILKGDL